MLPLNVHLEPSMEVAHLSFKRPTSKCLSLVECLHHSLECHNVWHMHFDMTFIMHLLNIKMSMPSVLSHLVSHVEPVGAFFNCWLMHSASLWFEQHVANCIVQHVSKTSWSQPTQMANWHLHLKFSILMFHCLRAWRMCISQSQNLFWLLFHCNLWSHMSADRSTCNTLICLQLATHRVSSCGTHGVVTHSQKMRFSAHRTSCC